MENKEIISIIEGYERDNEFIKVKDFTKFSNLVCIISYKGTGKSYSAFDYAIKDLIENDNEFAIVRNTAIELKNSKVKQTIVKLLHKYGVTDKYKVKGDGIYEVLDEKDKTETGMILKGFFLTVNKSFNVASQNAIESCKTIIYDEFINPEFHKKDLFSSFIKMCHTLMRQNVAKIFLLGNKHESNNDILAELGIEFDWEKANHQYIYRPEQDIVALYLGKWNIKKMESANKYIENLCIYSPSMLNFTAGKISSNNMYGVKNWYINQLESKFKPVFKYDLNNTRYCVGTIDDEGVKVVYIKQMYFASEFEECSSVYCYLPQDKLPDNIYIKDIENLTTIEYLIKNYSAGNLYFSHKYALDEFKMIKVFLKALMTVE